jgi:hypothetical protein
MQFKKLYNPLFVALSGMLYILVGYFTDRQQFYLLFGQYTLLFILFLLFHWKQKINLRTIILLSILLRSVLLFVSPELSNDFNRFIWDGRLILKGFNPYLSLPSEFIETGNFHLLGPDAKALYDGQGSLSPNNYTVYPPLNQLFFLISVVFFPESIIGSVAVMRIFIILADIGIIIYGTKILKRLDLPYSNIILYALNPFIILEFTGNLHFEGVMLFFLVVAIHFILKKRHFLSAVYFAAAISLKLIPLIFIPLFLRKLGQRNLFRYAVLVIIILMIISFPLINTKVINNFMTSIDLYFRKFEFNASIYYIIRWIGFQTIGWNIIQKVGPLLGLASFILVLMFSIIPRNEYNRQLVVSMLFVITIHYFLSTTVHPWYIATPLLLSIFTRYRFALLWSFLVMLSYSAYQNENFTENLFFVAIEYAVVMGMLLYEVFLKARPGRYSTFF